MATTIIQIRRDTAANWTANNPILAEGELGIELDTGLLKVGNNGARWQDSPYIQTAGPTGATGATGEPGLNGLNGLNGIDGLDGINGIDGAPGMPGEPGPPGAPGSYATAQTIVLNVSYDFAITPADAGKLFVISPGLRTIYIPSNVTDSIPVGSRFEFYQKGSGFISFSTVAPGITINTAYSPASMESTEGHATLIKVDIDEWILFGDLIPPGAPASGTGGG